MENSPESQVRRYFDAWSDPKVDELSSFFSKDATWVDGPQGVRRGADVIGAEITTQLEAVGGITVEIVTMVCEGRTVMVEQVSRARVGDSLISAAVMAVFEFDADGRITQWREAYDLSSMMNQIKAAAKASHSGKPNSATTP